MDLSLLRRDPSSQPSPQPPSVDTPGIISAGPPMPPFLPDPQRLEEVTPLLPDPRSPPCLLSLCKRNEACGSSRTQAACVSGSCHNLRRAQPAKQQVTAMSG